MSSPTQKILLLGAGELGTAFLPHLSALPNTYITIAVRTPSKYTHLTGPNISAIALDNNIPTSELAQAFSKYDIIINCQGTGQPAGTQKRIAEAVLEAGLLRTKIQEFSSSRLWYFPWQWGVDYDITGSGNGTLPLFGEQLSVRELLRSSASSHNVNWTIVSVGIFMSLLFSPYWGVVEPVEREGEKKIVVRALKGWDHKITATAVEDMGAVVAKIVAGQVDAKDKVVYTRGETVTYAQFADIIGRVTGKDVVRELWSVEDLKGQAEKSGDGVTVERYRLMFAGEGVSWEDDVTVNHKYGIPATDIETWGRKHFKV